jgi:tripartite-type tricarboxylate transporter receptor subunit TctC
MVSPAVAQSGVEAFYSGRTIELVVASRVGGGFNAYGRAVAKYITGYIPGKPSIIVKNMPGAGGRKATGWLANIAPKDGSVMLATMPGTLVEPILGKSTNLKYHPMTLGHVGSVAGFTTLCLVRTGSPVKTYADMMKTEVVMGGDQLGSTTHDHALMFKNLAGARVRLVKGYSGTRTLVLAIQQKEIDGFCGYAWASLMSRAPYLVKDKVVNLVVQFGLAPHPKATAAGVPPIWDFVKDPMNRKALELLAAVQVFGRPYVVPDSVPKERLAALRTAFDATMKDDGFLATTKKSKLDVSPTSGAQVEQLLRNIYDAPKDVQAKARWAITTE